MRKANRRVVVIIARRSRARSRWGDLPMAVVAFLAGFGLPVLILLMGVCCWADRYGRGFFTPGAEMISRANVLIAIAAFGMVVAVIGRKILGEGLPFYPLASGAIAGLGVSVLVAVQCVRAVEHDYGRPLPNGASTFCAVLAVELAIVAPMLYFGLATGLIEIVFPASWAREVKEESASCCEKCGYDLRGNESGVCPECGQAIK